MKILGIDHVGIAVERIEDALEFYCGRLGLQADPIEDKPEQGIRICRIHVGPVVLELIEARDWERTMQRYLPYKGPGVYHVGVRVEDVDASVAELERAGVPVLDREPREGDSMRVSFLAPEAASGTLLELVTHVKRK